MADTDKLKVVIADDEPIIVMNLKEILEDSGYSVVGEASNGFAAIDLCRSLHPDILIIDINMPGLDGLRTAKFVHESSLVETIIIESAFDDDELIETIDFFLRIVGEHEPAANQEGDRTDGYDYIFHNFTSAVNGTVLSDER